MANSKGRRRRFGAIRRLKSGRYQARYPGPDGVMRPAPFTFETTADADDWLAEKQTEIRRGEWRDPEAGAVSFRAYADKWVEERGLAPLTQDLYRYLLDKHLFAFAESDLDEITAPRVREWRTERLRATGAKTITAKAYRLLKAVMETAVDDELIQRNPCRIKGGGKEKAVERRIATVPQVDALANAVGMRWRLMVYLGAYGPMRPEELAGLRRRDVDLDTLQIRVRLAEPERMNGRRVQGDTKSEAGTRTVVLPAFLRRELRWHLESYAEAGPDGLIFVGEKGAPFRRSSFGRKWRRAREIVGMPLPVLRSPPHRSHSVHAFRCDAQGHDGAGGAVLGEGGADLSALRRRATAGSCCRTRRDRPQGTPGSTGSCCRASRGHR